MQQIIHSSDYTSFNLFGLCFTYICGLIIVIVAFSLDPFLDSLSDRFRCGAYSYLEWVSTETLQMQRMAFQGVQSGTWSGSKSSIPITLQAGEIMANLPLDYPIGQAFREKPASNAAPASASGASVRMSLSKTSVKHSSSTETRNDLPEVGATSPMTIKASPVRSTILTGGSTQSLRPDA